MDGDRLTALESSFLAFEHPGRPVHVGAVAVFEADPLLDEHGDLRLDAIRSHVASRLGALPRLRQRLASGRFAGDRPHWVDDPGFDVARHVHHVSLPPPGDDDAFRRLAAELHTAPLDHERPPWDIHLVTGLAGGHVGMVERAHHAIVDGVGGVDLAAVLLDLDRAGTVPVPVPEPVVRPVPRPPAVPGGPASDAASAAPAEASASPNALQFLAGAATGSVTTVLRPVADTVLRPRATARRAAAVAGAIAAVIDEGLLAPRTSLDVPAGPDRRLAWTGARLVDVKAAGKAAEATVNDVVLTAVAGGLRALLVARGEPVPHDLVLKALVPVNERAENDDHDLGNQVSAVLAPLPVGVASPVERLGLVASATRRLKGRHEADGFSAALHAADLLPMPLVRGLVRAAEHQPFVNLVVTNVPGPPVPLYLLGARMLEAVPIVPLAANLSLGAAVLSYGDALRICLTADADACPDVDVVVEGIEADLGALGAHSLEDPS